MALVAPQATVDAQRGGGLTSPPVFPTKEQFAASTEAQKHVAAARQLAGADLTKEFESTCSYTGPQRVALYGRERASRYWKIMDECATARVIALEQASGRTN